VISVGRKLKAKTLRGETFGRPVGRPVGRPFGRAFRCGEFYSFIIQKIRKFTAQFWVVTALARMQRDWLTSMPVVRTSK